jgi:hypothetical protein
VLALGSCVSIESCSSVELFAGKLVMFFSSDLLRVCSRSSLFEPDFAEID